MNYFHDVLLSKIQLISFLLLRVAGKNQTTFIASYNHHKLLQIQAGV